MKKHYKLEGIENQVRGLLTPERKRTKNGWPKLKGKAATVRSLATFCESLAQKYLDRKCVVLCTMMIRFYQILDEQPLTLSSDAKKEIAQLGQAFCELYGTIATANYTAGIKMWKGRPKLHMFLHLCEWLAPE